MKITRVLSTSPVLPITYCFFLCLQFLATLRRLLFIQIVEGIREPAKYRIFDKPKRKSCFYSNIRIIFRLKKFENSKIIVIRNSRIIENSKILIIRKSRIFENSKNRNIRNSRIFENSKNIFECKTLVCTW